MEKHTRNLWLAGAVGVSYLAFVGLMKFGTHDDPGRGSPLPISAATPPADAQDKPTPDQQRELCAGYSKLSETIMTGRQNNAPITEMLKVAENETTRRIVMQAYEKPMFRTEGNKREAIVQFGNEMYLACAKAADL